MILSKEHGNNGKVRSLETRKKMSDSLKGRKSPFAGIPNPSYHKDNAGKRSLHLWVEKWKGKTDTCENCGKSGLKGIQVQWANIDHKYRRVLDDYIRLCSKCHGKYDSSKGLRKRRGIYITLEELDKKMAGNLQGNQ